MSLILTGYLILLVLYSIWVTLSKLLCVIDFCESFMILASKMKVYSFHFSFFDLHTWTYIYSSVVWGFKVAVPKCKGRTPIDLFNNAVFVGHLPFLSECFQWLTNSLLFLFKTDSHENECIKNEMFSLGVTG